MYLLKFTTVFLGLVAAMVFSILAFHHYYPDPTKFQEIASALTFTLFGTPLFLWAMLSWAGDELQTQEDIERAQSAGPFVGVLVTGLCVVCAVGIIQLFA